MTQFIAVRLEDLMKSGMEVLINSLELQTGMISSCIDPPEVTGEGFLSTSLQLRSDVNYTKWISEHVDWNTERVIGYKMGERTHDAPELEVSIEDENEGMITTFKGDSSYSVFKTPVSSVVGPKIAWLLSFPSTSCISISSSSISS